MSFDNDTNHKRVALIVKTLGLINKSATSNKTPTEDILKMLEPAMAVLPTVTPTHITTVSGPMVQRALDACERSQRQTPRMIIRNAAEEAPLADLSIAMSVYITRIDEHLQSKD